MFILSLKVSSELNTETFDKVFDVLDHFFDIQGVISITPDGEEIETVANIIESDQGVTYEFDCETKVDIQDGNSAVAELEKLIEGDFELDAPVIN